MSDFKDNSLCFAFGGAALMDKWRIDLKEKAMIAGAVVGLLGAGVTGYNLVNDDEPKDKKVQETTAIYTIDPEIV